MLRRTLAVLALFATTLTTTIAAAPAASATAESAPLRHETAADRRYRGVGDDVIRIRATREPGLVRLTHDGDSNFIVHALDRKGKKSDLLVNEIGSYEGTVLYNAGYFAKGIIGLSIRADGPWTATFMPIKKARCWCAATIRGEGDQVLKLTPTRGLRVLRATHTGRSNFIVHAHTRVGDFPDLLINKIGRYRGKVLLPAGTRLITIKADGPWTLTRR